MTDPTRGARSRRGGRRPGWLLLTVLLVLAIVASSALVFTSRVELLKLAVILALWAAVVAAFVSVIYRRQSDMDQAKVRDLKLVYDLQLDREISARREYELSVETQLRRELSSELRAQSADEVAGLRAELAALRANLEILFDADLSHRPALETERRAVRAYSDWTRDADSTGRVTSSRIDTEDREDYVDFRIDTDHRTEESPIIDVPAEPHPPEPEWVPPAAHGGAHRRPSEAEQQGWPSVAEETPPHAWAPPTPPPSAPPTPPPRPAPEPQSPWPPPQQQSPPPQPAPPPPPPRPEPVQPQTQPPSQWQPAPAEGEFDPRGGARQQLGIAHRRERLIWRVRRQAAGPRSGDAVTARRTSARPPFRTAGGRRPRSAAIATDLGRRTCGSPAALRTPATARAAPAARGAAPSQRRRDRDRDHRRAVGRRAAREAPGRPHRRRSSPPPRRVR